MQWNRRAGTIAAAVTVVLVLSGCGALLDRGGTAPDGTPIPPATELYVTMRAASLSAESGHVEGFLSQDGETLSVDIEGTADGSNMRALVEGDRGAVELVSVKGRHYLGGDWDFWSIEADAKTADALVGKYVLVPEEVAADAAGMNLRSIIEAMFPTEELGPLSAALSDVREVTHLDRKVWIASNPIGGEFWVDRASGHLVRVLKSGDDASELNFDSWDAVERVKAPPKAKVLRK